MSWWRRAVRSLLGDRAMNERIDDEMAFHIEMRTQENLAAGMTPAAAARAARLAFGNRSVQTEETRDARALPWLENLSRDVRFGVRSLWRRPGLWMTGVLSLALGVGATTTAFSLLDAVALKPLPFPELGRLYVVAERKEGEAVGGNPLRMRDYGEQVGSFSAVAGYFGESAIITGPGEPERLDVRRTFGSYFEIFGPTLSSGRVFSVDERAGQPVLVVRERTAVRWFGSAAGALGRTVTVDGTGHTIVGIAGNTGYPADIDAWAPASAGLQAGPRRGSYLFTVAKLAPEATEAQAGAELALVLKRLGREYPETDGDREARLVPLQAQLVGDARTTGLVVLGIAAAVLLIACLNVASLLLARTMARRRESALRAALGAGTRSLVRLYLTESVVLAFAGGLLGVGLAWLAVPLVRSMDLPFQVPRLAEAAIDGRVLLFALGLMVISAAVFGTLPAIRAAKGSLVPSLNRAPPRARARDLIVVGQAALALAILVGAVTMLDGFLRLRGSSFGFDTEGVVTARINLAWGSDGAALADFRARTLEGLAAIPGVQSVGVVDRLPLEGGTQSGPVVVAGRTLAPELAAKSVSIRATSAGYFTTMGIPIVDGRPLGDRGTAVVNEEFARLFLGPEPIGERVTVSGDQQVEVVGVVRGVRQWATDEQIMPEISIRADETYWPLLVFVLKTDAPVAAIAPAIRARVLEIDPKQIIDEIKTMDDQLVGVAETPKILAGLLSAFAAVALILVTIGLYGILSGYVNNRIAEIAVRIALGATPVGLVGRIAGRGLRLALIGVGGGIGLSLLFGRVLAEFPVSLRTNEPGLLAIVAVFFLVIATIACVIPAWRAAWVDPAAVLRNE